MYAHGLRRTYRAGCRCVRCRASNAAYAAARRAATTPATLDATPARAQLQRLARLGVGYRRAAQLAGLAVSLVRRIRAGTAARIRPATAAAIAAIRPSLAHGALVAGTKTHRFVDSLHREGFTDQRIAFQLGAQSRQFQLHRRVRVRSALRVAQLYDRLAVQ